MAKRTHDVLADLRQRAARILLRDARAIEVMSKGFCFSEDEIDGFIANPDIEFPFTVRGITFKNRNSLNLARHALKSKKNWPAGLQAAADRFEGFVKTDLIDPKKKVPTINVNRMYVALPAPAAAEALPAANVLRLQRSETGELSRILDVEAEPAKVAK